MDEELRRCYEKKELVSLYADIENTNKFLAGYINYTDDSGVIINHITPYGTCDGYVYLSVDDIYRLETHSIYIQKIKKLMSQNYRKKHKELKIDNEQSLFTNYLMFAKKTYVNKLADR